MVLQLKSKKTIDFYIYRNRQIKYTKYISKSLNKKLYLIKVPTHIFENSKFLIKYYIYEKLYS